MSDEEIGQRVRAARELFVHTLLPSGVEVAHLLHAGVSLHRIRSLYPEAFEGFYLLHRLPELAEHLDLPKIQVLLNIYSDQISDLWEDAYRASQAGSSDGQILFGVIQRLEWRSDLLDDPEIVQLRAELSRSWANVQALRFHQLLLPKAKEHRTRHVRDLLVCLGFFWSLSGSALIVLPEHADQILGLFEPLLETLADAKSEKQATVTSGSWP